LVVFDCDGTLVDSAALILAAMDRAFAGAGHAPPPETAVRSIVGLSLVEAMATLVPEADAAVHFELAGHYKRSFAELRGEGLHDERLFPGIADLLDELDRTGRLLAVATGKSRRGLDHLVQKHGWHGRFVSLQTADHHPSKPHPAMLLRAMADAGVDEAEAVMIGDTSYDMAMARSARVTGIGVTWGHHPEVLLRDAGADHVAADVDVLRGLLLA
jgi:phosphoglycolate phosphatase